MQVVRFVGRVSGEKGETQGETFAMNQMSFMTARHHGRQKSETKLLESETKLPAASMLELPPFGIEHSMANKHQSKGRQLPKLMCPTNHARKNLCVSLRNC